MARIRSLKPEIWMSPQVMNLSHSARLLFVGLITQADDEGRGTADPRRCKAAIFGGDDVTSSDIRRWLDECVGQALLVVYDDEQHGFLYQLPSWKSHQSIDRPRKSSYPAPPTSSSARRATVEDSSGIGPDRSGMEGKGMDRTLRAREAVSDSLLQTPVPSTGCGVTDGELMDGFAALVAAYPKRAMPHSLLDEREYQQRIEDGVPHAQMLEGAVRFAAFVVAGGVSGPQYVMAIRNFLSIPNRHWQQPWDPPKAGDDARVAENLAAGQDWLARG